MLPLESSWKKAHTYWFQTRAFGSNTSAASTHPVRCRSWSASRRGHPTTADRIHFHIYRWATKPMRTHLYRTRQFRAPFLQHLGEVLAGMPASSEVKRDLSALVDRQDAAGEHPRAIIGRIALQHRHAHAGVVVMDHRALCACRINSSRAGLSGCAASSTISHCVAAGNGMPRLCSRCSSR